MVTTGRWSTGQPREALYSAFVPGAICGSSGLDGGESSGRLLGSTTSTSSRGQLDGCAGCQNGLVGRFTI